MAVNAHEFNSTIKEIIARAFLLEEVSDDTREDLFAQIARLVFQSVLLRVVPLLDEEDLEVYNQLLTDGADINQCTDFFLRTVPLFESIIREEVQNMAIVLEKQNPGILAQHETRKKIEDIRTILLQKFS